MSTSTMELRQSLRSLIDERLDAIERVLLMTGVSRGERREILGEVEAHVFELLGRRTVDEPTRADVLAVFSQLDPPESYVPEGFDRRLVKDSWSVPQRREPQLSLLAVVSAAVGAFVAPALVFSALALEDTMLMALGALTILAVSVVGCCSLVRIHRSRGWLYGMRPALFAALLFPLLTVNECMVLGLSEMQDLVVLGGIASAFLVSNGAIVYFAWRLCSKGFSRAKQLS